MGAPINAFETIESIRFFAQLVGTEGLSTVAKETANDYIERLLSSLDRNVKEVTAGNAGLTIV